MNWNLAGICVLLAVSSGFVIVALRKGHTLLGDLVMYILSASVFFYALAVYVSLMLK